MLESTAGGELFRNLGSNSELLFTVRVQTDTRFDDDGDGVDGAYGTSTMLDSEAKSQVIDLNFEHTGGTAGIDAATPFHQDGALRWSLSEPTAHPTYTLDVRTHGGIVGRSEGIGPDAQGFVSLPESALAPGVANFVRARGDGDGPQAYTAPVVVTYDPTVTPSSGHPVRSIAVGRVGTDLVIRWATAAPTTATGYVLFERPDGTKVVLSPSIPLSSSSWTVPLQALSAPCGTLYTSSDAGGSVRGPGAEMPSPTGSSHLEPNEPGCGSTGPPPPPGSPTGPALASGFHHRDHLGSLRVVTDAGGAVVSRHDYYPFGTEAGPDGTAEGGAASRKRFTGHERDDGTGLDYMLARYYGGNLGRFLSVDPGNDTHVLDPQRWNLYMYGRNNPLALVDPTGEGIIDSVSNFWHGLADKAAAGGQAIASAGQRANDGSAVGVAVDFAASMTGGAIAGAGDALRIGSSTGEAIGSGAGFEGHLRAAGEEAGRVGTWAAALASAGAAAEGAGLGSAEASGARGLGNPFKGKSAGEVDGMFKAKGFEPKGPDPVGGKGGYVNPETGRSYHIDPGGTYKKGTEAPHVDVNRPKGSDLPKKKYEM